MENLLKQCGIEHLSSVFKQKNIDLATLEMFVDPKKPVHVQENLRRLVSNDCGLTSGEIAKICDFFLQKNHKSNANSPSRRQTGPSQAQSRVASTAFSNKVGSKRVQALLGVTQSPNGKALPQRQHQRIASLEVAKSSQVAVHKDRPADRQQTLSQAHRQSIETAYTLKKVGSTSIEHRLREAFSRAPANLHDDINDASGLDLPPKTVSARAISQVGNITDNKPVVQVISDHDMAQRVEHPKQAQVTMIDTCPQKPVEASTRNEEVQPLEVSKKATQTYEELNKPLQFAQNQEIIARKITEFRNSIIEQFGSSNVPTPQVKDVYKQCAGGLSSESQATLTVENTKLCLLDQAPSDKEMAVQEMIPSGFKVELNVPVLESVDSSQEDLINVQQIVQQVKIDGRLSQEDSLRQQSQPEVITSENGYHDEGSVESQSQETINAEQEDLCIVAPQETLEQCESQVLQAVVFEKETSPSINKWNEVMQQIAETRRELDAAAEYLSPVKPSVVLSPLTHPPVYVQEAHAKGEEEENSYMEPSYDEVDQSDSYELTVFVQKNKSENQIEIQNIPKEHVAKPESDDEGIEDYDCTHDQQLSDQEDLNSVDEHSMEDDDQEANEVEEVYNNISPEIKQTQNNLYEQEFKEMCTNEEFQRSHFSSEQESSDEDFISGRRGTQVFSRQQDKHSFTETKLVEAQSQQIQERNTNQQPQQVQTSGDESSSEYSDEEDQQCGEQNEVVGLRYIPEEQIVAPVFVNEDVEVDREDDTSSEGQNEAIESTRVAAENNMVEITDQSCVKPTITLCEMGTQTETIETFSVAVTAKPPTPPALLDNQSQTFIIKQRETATQMSPPIKKNFVQFSEEQGPNEPSPQKQGATVEEKKQIQAEISPVKEEPELKIEQIDSSDLQDHQVNNKKQQKFPSPTKKVISPITKQFIAESKKTFISQREEKLLNGISPTSDFSTAPARDENAFNKPRPAYASPAPKAKDPSANQIILTSPVQEEVSPSKLIAQKKRDLNKPFSSKIDKKQLQKTRLAMLLSTNSSGLTTKTNGTPAIAFQSAISENKPGTPDYLALHKKNSSSVSSNIAEFIPMRSIIKSNDVQSRPELDESREENARKLAKISAATKKRKVVRFDDMILIGEDKHQIQLFLSDEEASIIEKKATPTKLNLQSSAELRKRIRQEASIRTTVQQHRKTAAPEQELSIENILESKRRRTQTTLFGQRSEAERRFLGSDSTKNGIHSMKADSFEQDHRNLPIFNKTQVCDSGPYHGYYTINSAEKQNTKANSSPDDKDAEYSSNSSPEKYDTSYNDFERSYEGDQDMDSGRSRLKKRRQKKHRNTIGSENSPGGKDKKNHPFSPSPNKKKNSSNLFDGSDGNDASADSQADQALRVALSIKGYQMKYQPTEQTKSTMSAQSRAKLQGSIQAILGYKKH